MRMKHYLVIILSLLLQQIFAAVGCDLNDPDRDVKRMFPNSSSYKTTYTTIKQKGGEALLSKVETRLGDKFTGSYETIDVPYTLYSIYNGKQLIGYIHGVNQKGKYGGIQVFLATDVKGIIKTLYVQKVTSPDAKKWRNPSFGAQFHGLGWDDFASYQIKTGKGLPSKIKNPGGNDNEFMQIIRAVKKNLILIDEFLLV